MSLVLDTGTMKYRQNPNQPWRPLVIKAGMNWESMADTYDPDNGTYEVGQYVLEEGMMYRCISEITTPEAWTPAHWTSVNVGDELSSFIIISDDQPTDETNKIWIAETTAPFGVQVPTMDDHNALGNTLNQLETETETVENGLAIIVEGNSCTSGADKGRYVYLKDSTITGYADGLYTAAQAIPANTAIDGTYLTAVSGGGLNALKSNVLQKVQLLAPVQSSTTAATYNLSDSIENYLFLVCSIGADQSRTQGSTTLVFVNYNVPYNVRYAELDIGFYFVSSTSVSITSVNGNWYFSIYGVIKK